MANEEHVEILKSGIGAWNEWRKENPDVRPDLEGADLRGAILSNASLGYANLRGADLRDANLRGANLSGAILRDADLRGANLRGANLEHAYLGDADLRDADLGCADLGGNNPSNRADGLSCANLEGAKLSDANLRGADLSDANLEGANLEGANLFRANLSDADLRGADLFYAELCRANLIRADLRDTNLSYANLRGAQLSFANLRDANLRDAYLRGAYLRGAHLSGTNLSRSKLRNTAVINVDLSKAAGIEEVRHDEPSSVGTDTLERTARGLAKNPSRQGAVETFLRGAGVEEQGIAYFRSLIKSVCSTFIQRACATYELIASWNVIEHGEESITDINLFEIARRHPNEVRVKKYSRVDEGRRSGADWEWWFGSPGHWLGLRIQAKKIHPKNGRYPSLDHENRHGLQVDMLIESSRKDMLVPLYCFYDAPPGRSQHFGCTIAAATDVKGLI